MPYICFKLFQMESPIGKDERIELRVSARDKIIFKRAQELSGDKSFSSFIIRIVKKEAEEIVAKNNRIIATEKDRQLFFDAVMSNLEPNAALNAAAERYKTMKSSD